MMAVETRTFYKMQENIFNFATQMRFDSFAGVPDRGAEIFLRLKIKRNIGCVLRLFTAKGMLRLDLMNSLDADGRAGVEAI